MKNAISKILTRTIYRWKAKSHFGKCGKRTYCIKPIRIIGGKHINVGSDVSILNGLRIEAYVGSKEAKDPIIEIGNDTNIEQNVHITGGHKVHIGEQCSLLSGCVITDINHPYENISIPASKQTIKSTPVSIGNQCFIGTHAVILPGVTLGKHVVVGANSVVTKSFPDNCVIAGIPAKIIKQYNQQTQIWE